MVAVRIVGIEHARVALHDNGPLYILETRNHRTDSEFFSHRLCYGLKTA
jgi:hypothetical protein